MGATPRGSLAATGLGLLLFASTARAVDLDAVIARLDADVAAGKPLVAHVVVALVDNEHQGIVPVPASLGDGSAPRSNLYWGALYGVKSWFRRQPGWRAVAIEPATDSRVLDRALFQRSIERGGKRIDAYLVAEAWHGERIADAIRHFLEMDRGGHVTRVRVGGGTIDTGGAAHLIAFVGHNGLMDFAAPGAGATGGVSAAHASAVLACMSDSYFTPLLSAHSAPLIMTTGLMAPEAYTLDAIVQSWFAGAAPAEVRVAAARAYAHHQKIAETSARRLFRTPSANR
jgi:hypothetical protein